MRVENNVSQPSFKKVIVSDSAAKLLKKTDKFINQQKKVKAYLIHNLPEGHKKPLWSVMYEQVKARHADNKNHIFIDTIMKKGKELLSITTFDKTNYLIEQQVVSHKVKIGTKLELYDKVLNSYWGDGRLYGKSPFFEALENAENQVNTLHRLDLGKIATRSISARELPKQVKTKVQNGQSRKSQAKKLKKQEENNAKQFLVTIQDLPKNVKIKIPKLAPSDKERMPRKLKKKLNNDKHINKLV